VGTLVRRSLMMKRFIIGKCATSHETSTVKRFIIDPGRGRPRS
jgi:hypothetical protein